MTGDPCINCGQSEAAPRDLQVRNTRHREVALCETCHKSIVAELDGNG